MIFCALLLVPSTFAQAPKAKVAAKPATEATCESCHKDIGKISDKGSQHPAMGSGCDTCHEPHGMGQAADPKNPKHLKKQPPALCADCHDVQERAQKSKFSHAIVEDCTTCHNPHGSENARLLKDAQPALCESCHSDQAEAHKNKKFLHKPAFETGCSTCHEPHGTDNVAHLRAPVNDLCLTCHADNAKGEQGSDDKSLVFFNGAVHLPADYLNQVKRVALDAGATKGHPTATHPVVTTKPVKLNNKPMACNTCHDPHASANSPRFFVTDKKSPSQLCIRCHE